MLPDDYSSLLTPKETQQAIVAVKRYIEDGLCEQLDLQMVQVPLIVDADSGVNDNLDRDGSRTPVAFHIANDNGAHPVDAQVVQAATKWKRLALEQFAMGPGEGLCTDMRAIRKDYFLDHDHSAYVDQWDWERAITADQRNLDFLKDTVRRIWSVLRGAEAHVQRLFPQLADARYPNLPEEITFVHAEELLARYPDLPRKLRETRLLQEIPAVFILGIGWTLEDGYPHELRAADYDDWVTPTTSPDGRPTHGLNGDILVWNPVTRRRHELSSMGIRVDASTLHQQLELTGQLELAAAAVPPGHRRRHHPAVDRWRHRSVPHPDAVAAEGTPGRGERDGVAGRVEADVRPAQHPRARLRTRRPGGAGAARPQGAPPPARGQGGRRADPAEPGGTAARSAAARSRARRTTCPPGAAGGTAARSIGTMVPGRAHRRGATLIS